MYNVSENNVMNDATMFKMKALADLEMNMQRLESIVEQKDVVIEGLKISLDQAIERLENKEDMNEGLV